MHPFTVVFLAVLALATATRLWLAWRQIRHVTAHRDAVPGDFRDRISLEAHRKAADYTVAKTRVSMVEAVTGALLALALTLGGGLEALARLWSGVFEPDGYAHGVALLVSVGLVTAAVDLPFAWHRTFGIEARFGFNRTTPRLWLVDRAKGLVLALAIGVPLLLVVLWLMAGMGSAWWLYVWLALVAATLLANLAAPLVMAWFNRFSPLEDEGLKERIESLLAECGFRSRGLYVMDASRRSAHGNAFFAGFGRSKRIVLFDTLLERLAPAEIEAVLAHELGHFSLHHIWKQMAFRFAITLVLLGVLAWLMTNDWFYTGLGVTQPGTAMALALFSIVAPEFMFVLAPVASLFSRRHEYEADAYAAAHASAGGLVRALVKLYQDNAATLTPDPLHSAFYDSHPPATLRIARLQGSTP